MALKDIFKVSRKTFVNPSGWFGYGEVSSTFRNTWELAKNLFVPTTLGTPETFDEAMQCLQLTEADIQETQKNYLFYSIIFLVCASVSLLAGIYLLIAQHSFAGFLLSFAVIALFLTQAFRFNFWYFQIKHRKLGCTFEEWRSGKVKDKPQGPSI